MPLDHSILTSKYVYFQWQSVPDVELYQLHIATIDSGKFEDNLIISLNDNTHGRLEKNSLEFGNNYRWRVRAVTMLGDTLNWSNEHYFGIVVLPDSIREGFTPSVAKLEAMQPGLTISSPFGIPVGIEHDGEVVWYLPGERHWNNGQWALSQLANGNFISLHRGGIRIFNVNNDTLNYINPAEFRGMHHEVVRTSNRNYLTLIPSLRWLPAGNDSIYWKADRIIELNVDGDLIWSWDCWDYLSTEDFDRGEYNNVPPRGIFDWTHANAAFLNKREDAIYLSLRNLSRIVKIAYPCGEIIWSMGQQMASGDIDFGTELEFFRQHSPEVLEDESILLYDNHWIFGEIGKFSRAIKIGINMDNDDSARLEWQYEHQFSRTQGDVNRLDNGNILINTGSSFFFYEVDRSGEIIWEIQSNLAVGNYRAERIATLFPLIYTASGPTDHSVLPTGEFDIEYTVNNEGEISQEFSYQFSDDDGYITPTEGNFQLSELESRNLKFQVIFPKNIRWVNLNFSVTPLADIENEYLLRTTHPVRQRLWPEIFELNIKCYPNPFNNSAILTYTIIEPGLVIINLYDINGRLVKRLGSFQKSAGIHTFDLQTNKMNSGLYLVRITTNGASSVSKIILMK